MSLPRIIGIAGPAGSGKDTVGALLSMVGYRMVAFADALRAEVMRALEDSVTLGEISAPAMPEDVERCFMALLNNPDVVYTKPTPDEARVVLQWWGEWRRQQDSFHWIKPIAALFPANEAAGAVICDLRHGKEDTWVHASGGKVLWIERSGAGLKGGIEGHISERFEGVHPDLTIHNTGLMKDLAESVRNALREFAAEGKSRGPEGDLIFPPR